MVLMNFSQGPNRNSGMGVQSSLVTGQCKGGIPSNRTPTPGLRGPQSFDRRQTPKDAVQEGRVGRECWLERLVRVGIGWGRNARTGVGEGLEGGGRGSDKPRAPTRGRSPGAGRSKLWWGCRCGSMRGTASVLGTGRSVESSRGSGQCQVGLSLQSKHGGGRVRGCACASAGSCCAPG